jgi:serine protease inhibitor
MPTSAVGQHVEQAHLGFALAVQHALAGTPAETACWSPYSVASALGLAATGARGATRRELTTLLLSPAEGNLLELAAMLTQAASLPGLAGETPVLGIANTLWADESLPIQPEFRSELAAWPNGAMRNAPFTTDPETVRRLINADVAETTRGLIAELVGADDITDDHISMLVNALYLKVAWNRLFPPQATAPLPFHGPDTTTQVPTMRLDGQLRYAATHRWQVVVLPAAGVDAVVLLPDGPLPPAEAALDAETLARLLAAPKPTQLHLYLPKFRVRATANLNDTLRELGVLTMFTGKADFSGFSTFPMAVDAVLHEAVLTIDEQGLEGAAATALRAIKASRRGLSQPIEVRVDHPFLFLVRHRQSGALYFLARVVTP